MSGRRIEGERVYCHVCNHEWDRNRGGIECPRCDSDFVEILEPGATASIQSFHDGPPSPEPDPVPQPLHEPDQRAPPNPLASLLNHNPWNDDDLGNDPSGFTTFEFNGNGVGGRISFTTRTTRSGGSFRRGRLDRGMPPPFGELPYPFASNNAGFPPDANAGMQQGNVQDLFSLILQSMQPMHQMQPAPGGGRQRDPALPPSPFTLLNHLLNPANAQHGDMVYSDEAFDRIMTQLMQQTGAGSNAPPPASAEAIDALPTKKVDKEMLGTDGKAECSICMESVELGTEVANLPCNHWFHGECVKSWLREHDTCPHCRQPITERDPQQPGASPRRTNRPHRRPSSVSSPRAPAPGSSRTNPITIPESPSSLREARQSYYGRRRDSDGGRPDYPRHTSDHRGDRDRDGRRPSMRGGNEEEQENHGGITGWIRDRLPFSGS